jgi:tight adherence protein B
VFAEPAAALAVGGDVPAVFHRLSATPGQSGLADLGLAWDVAQATGASLTTALDSMAERMDQEATAAQAARAELSAARSTSRILAALPFAGIGLGYGIGGDPLHFLTGSLVGEILLVTGMALACAGVLWTERIANG